MCITDVFRWLCDRTPIVLPIVCELNRKKSMRHVKTPRCILRSKNFFSRWPCRGHARRLFTTVVCAHACSVTSTKRFLYNVGVICALPNLWRYCVSTLVVNVVTVNHSARRRTAFIVWLTFFSRHFRRFVRTCKAFGRLRVLIACIRNRLTATMTVIWGDHCVDKFLSTSLEGLWFVLWFIPDFRGGPVFVFSYFFSWKFFANQCSTCVKSLPRVFDVFRLV